MPTSSRTSLEGDHFRRARELFEDTVAWISGPAAPRDYASLEDALAERGRGVMLALAQGRLDSLAAAELADRAKAPASPASEDVAVRVRSRQLESTFGRLQFRRLGYKAAGAATRYPLDEALNLPRHLYTYPLQRRVLEEGRGGAWDHAVERVDSTTGGHVPKRQAEQLAGAATVDFDAFYKQQPANDLLGPEALLVASSDCKGIRMLPRALRDATRKAAEQDRAEVVRGDPMATKKPRSHDKRMAIVTAVWEQQPNPRAAHDVVSELRRSPRPKPKPAKDAPRPQNKRVTASVEKSLATGVSDMFDELDRRDPAREREAVVLVDGEENQQTAILAQASDRGRRITVVLDLIHVIHYLWLAGFALCRRNHAATDVWVARHLLLLLSSPVAELIETIARAAAKRRLSKGERAKVDKALKYLRRNASFMNYADFLRRGLPIATGVIEGACRHLIQDRLGITGARWDLAGAEAVLRLRALRSSGDWDDYWRFHQQQEAGRNHAAA